MDSDIEFEDLETDNKDPYVNFLREQQRRKEELESSKKPYHSSVNPKLQSKKNADSYDTYAGSNQYSSSSSNKPKNPFTSKEQFLPTPSIFIKDVKVKSNESNLKPNIIYGRPEPNKSSYLPEIKNQAKDFKSNVIEGSGSNFK